MSSLPPAPLRPLWQRAAWTGAGLLAVVLGIAGIFLPLSVLTGFFGMNFGWMVREISSGTAFLALGVVLPLAIVAGILGLIASRGLFRE